MNSFYNRLSMCCNFAYMRAGFRWAELYHLHSEHNMRVECFSFDILFQFKNKKKTSKQHPTIYPTYWFTTINNNIYRHQSATEIKFWTSATPYILTFRFRHDYSALLFSDRQHPLYYRYLKTEKENKILILWKQNRILS